MKSKVPKVKESDFSPADLVERFEIKLSDTEEADLVRWIDEEKSTIKEDRGVFLSRQEKFLYNWDDFVTFSRKGPWKDSSSLHMPLTYIKVKSYLSRLYNIFTDENTTQLIPREPSDEAFVKYMKMLRGWYLWDYLNGYKGIRSFAREAFQDCVTVGFGIGMKDWIVQVRKILDIRPKEFQREMEDLQPQVEETPGELATGEEMEKNSISTTTYEEVQKVLTVFEGTRLQSIPVENAYFPNFIPGSSDLDFPKLVVIDNLMSLSDLMLKAKRGEWDEKRVKKVIEKGDHVRTTESLAARREDLTGYSSSPEKGKRLIEYCFCSYDIDDDDINEEIVVTKCEKEILKVTLLDRISPSGFRPLVKFDCFTKPRQGYSRGVPEFLYPLNEEMDQHHNMRIDYLSLQVCPFGVYRASSSLKNEPIQISPGKFIPVDEITDMKVLNFSTNPNALAGEEDRMWHYADLLTSSSSLNQGVVPQTVGPTRSTSGVMALLRQMDKEFIVTIDAIAEQWKKLERLVLDDLDYRISPAVKMRVLGASISDALRNQGDPNVSNALLVNAQFDLKIDVARAVTSDEIRRNDAEMILNKLVAPSMLQQSGVVGTKAFYRALSVWLNTFCVEEAEYIDKPDMIAKPLTLYQEIQYCTQAVMPPMAAQDDHQAKAQNLILFLKSPECAEGQAKGLISPQAVDMMMQAAKKHMTIAEMMEPKELPNPTGANEASMNQVQAGTAPQQGGENPEKTTSRELPETNEPPKPKPE